MRETTGEPFWMIVAGYPLFVLRLFIHPRSLVRSLDFADSATLARLALYLVITVAILVAAFSDNRPLAEKERPRLATFKAVAMRAHDTSWGWLEPVYAPLNISQGEAKRLWDTLLTTGFLLYTFAAALIALAVIARLRMAWRRIGWEHAIGTAMLGYMAAVPLVALSLVPLAEVLICRHCGVRVALFILLNLSGWTYLGMYTLGDFGERPAGWFGHLLKSLGYGALQYACAYVVFFALVACIIPV